MAGQNSWVGRRDLDTKIESGSYGLLCHALKCHQMKVAKVVLEGMGCRVNSKSNKPANTPLHFAVLDGNIEIIKKILDKGAFVDIGNADGETPLHNAVEKNKIAVTELLLKHDADVSLTDNNGLGPLHIAVEKGNLEAIDLLLKFGADVNYLMKSERKKNYAPLHLAVENGIKDIVLILLNNGANVDVKGHDNKTPLHIAAKKGYTHIAEVLLNHGACIEALTLKVMYTPLHFASALGNEDAVKLFLTKGADVNATAGDNTTPLHIATERGYESVVKLLLQHGAEVDSLDKDGKTVLYLAVKIGYSIIIEDVLKCCPKVDIQSNRNALKIAVFGYGEKYKKIVEDLLQYGLIFNARDANNSMLFHEAVRKGYFKIVEDLLKYGANVNMLSCSVEGFTPLHNAVKHQLEEITKLLVTYGANINAKDKTDKTPIAYAVQNADLKTTKLLLINGANIKDDPSLLRTAVRKQYLEMIEILLQYDADVNACDKYGRTALHFTALHEPFLAHQTFGNGNIRGQIAELLLHKGADVDARTNIDLTTLYFAVQNTYEEVIEVLLKYKSDVNQIVSRRGITPLHAAASEGHERVIEILLKSGADIYSRDINGYTALHIASQDGNLNAIAKLLEYGSDINAIDKNCFTPIDFAITLYNEHSPNMNIDSHYIDYNSIRISEKIIKTFQRHIIKMQCANFYVNKRSLCLLDLGIYPDPDYDSDSDSGIDCFGNKCMKQIASMKSTKICNITFYDILTKTTSFLVKYLRNENIFLVLESDDYKTNIVYKFSMYKNMIEYNILKGMERKELIDEGNRNFNLIFKNLPALPYVCTEIIFSYLSDKDLRNLMSFL